VGDRVRALRRSYSRLDNAGQTVLDINRDSCCNALESQGGIDVDVVAIKEDERQKTPITAISYYFLRAGENYLPVPSITRVVIIIYLHWTTHSSRLLMKSNSCDG
jgi:hypothetical protein